MARDWPHSHNHLMFCRLLFSSLFCNLLFLFQYLCRIYNISIFM